MRTLFCSSSKKDSAAVDGVEAAKETIISLQMSIMVFGGLFRCAN